MVRVVQNATESKIKEIGFKVNFGCLLRGVTSVTVQVSFPFVRSSSFYDFYSSATGPGRVRCTWMVILKTASGRVPEDLTVFKGFQNFNSADCHRWSSWESDGVIFHCCRSVGWIDRSVGWIDGSVGWSDWCVGWLNRWFCWLNRRQWKAVTTSTAKYNTLIRKRFIINRLTENVQKWTRVFSTRRRVILVARKRRKKREENSVSTFGRFRLWTSFESSPVSVNTWFFRHFSLKNWQNFQTLRLRVTIWI